MKESASAKEIESVEKLLAEFGFQTHPIQGEKKTVIGAIGDKRLLSMNQILTMDGVENVVPIMKPYKLASKELHKEPSVIEIGHGITVGGKQLAVFAGPCAIESQEQFTTVSKAVKASGANILRGGAFKPRSSPYSFQGLGKEGIDLLIQARKITGLPIVTEIMDLSDLDCFADVDVVQVGARNMQNFTLLKALGRSDKPVLLKRGLSSTLQELLMSAEYIMSEGNQNVILCERGIRTFEPATRNTLDLSAVPLLQQKTHLPITVDPSHATGIASLVEPMALCAVTAGCDALEIEVHNDPKNAWSDGAQSLTPAQFAETMKKVKALSEFMGKPLDVNE